MAPKPRKQIKTKAEFKRLRQIEQELASGIFVSFDFFIAYAKEGGIDYALEWCCYYGRLDLVVEAIKSGANVNSSNSAALQMASRGSHLDIIKYIVESGQINNQINLQVLMESIEKSNYEIVTYLTSSSNVFAQPLCDVNGEYGLALRTAIEMQDVEMIRILISNGADAKVMGSYPIELALKTANSEIIELVK